MGAVVARTGRMVEVKLSAGKPCSVQTVLPVTVREVRTQPRPASNVVRAANMLFYLILFLGLLAILATMKNFRNTNIQNRRLMMEVTKLQRKKAMLEKCSRSWVPRHQLARAIAFMESDLEPFMVTEEMEEETTGWFVFWPPPVLVRLDIVRIVEELDREIYNNTEITEGSENTEEAD